MAAKTFVSYHRIHILLRVNNNNNNNNNNLHSTFRSAGNAAEAASVRKESKYSTVPSDLIFQPTAMETQGPLNASALNFLSEIDRRLSSVSGDSRETSFLFQRLSVIVQRFNSVLVLDSFCTTDEDRDL